MLDKANRQRAYEAELSELAGGAALIPIGTLQTYYGLGYESVKRRLKGVKHQPGGLYRVKDVAAKLAQDEQETA